jgi:hypothetical protein
VSHIDAHAWHSLVGRYDGAKIAIFCDGREMGSTPARGKLVPNAGPVLIGAGIEDGKPIRHFVGELEAAAIWARALSDLELAALCRP